LIGPDGAVQRRGPNRARRNHEIPWHFLCLPSGRVAN
jgi:hypothetical protein